MESNLTVPAHFHANWTSNRRGYTGEMEPDALFATEQEAREYLATDYAERAVYYVNDQSCDGDRSLVWESFEMARAIQTGDGAPLSWDDGPILDGREWQCEDEYHWFERCSKPECGNAATILPVAC